MLVTREPGGVHVSEQIRGILVQEDMDPLTEAMLFAASRIEMTKKVILPALKEGKVVICDRFVDSSYVYQGMVRGLGLETIQQIYQPIINIVSPDVTFYFDLEPEVGLERIKINQRETNRFDKEMMDFHYRVRNGYRILSQMRDFSHRIRVVNADQAPQEVANDCIRELCK